MLDWNISSTLPFPSTHTNTHTSNTTIVRHQNVELLKQHNLEALKVAREEYHDHGSEGAMESEGPTDAMSVADDLQGAAQASSSVLVHDASTAAAAAAAAVRAAQQEVGAQGVEDEVAFYDPPPMPTVLSDPGPGRR